MTLGALGLGFALVCAGLMGFAIQRGATCMVAAIDEIVSDVVRCFPPRER